MNLPSPLVFSPEDNPDLDPKFLDQLNQSFDALHDNLGAVATSDDLVDKPFLTPASGNADVQAKNPLAQKPVHVQVTNVRRDDGAAITSPYSTTWMMKSDLIVVSFIGLAASTKFFFTARVE